MDTTCGKSRRASSLPRRRVKHKLEYPPHTVCPYNTWPVMTQQKVCTTVTEIRHPP
ncbi:hypothetical protein BE221DRAFT_167019, partial [Ostreococcus tauri]